MMWLPSELFILFFIHVYAASDHEEVTIPVSSAIKLECYDGLRVNNINVTIRRSPTTCLTKSEECSLPIQTIETIKETCNKQASCEVDIRTITNNQSCLYEYGYFNVLYTCKKIIDFSCDFESDLCNWTPVRRQERFRWIHGSRSTFTIPAVDHTSASNTGRYVYIYSGRSFEGDIAELESGHIITTEHQCLSFWYFTTNVRDSVHVFQNKEHLLNLTNNYAENIWNHIQISLGKKSRDSFKLVFRVTRGNSADLFGAIAIDDISIENQNCNSFILQCDFENNCDWDNNELNQYEWKKQKGQPSSENKGPSTDHSTATENGHYMYLGRPNDDVTRAMDYASYLEYQNVNLHAPGNFCLKFWYHMYDNDYGKQRLNVTIDNELVWTEYGNRDNKWKSGTIDLHSRNTFSIKFIGILGWNYLNAVNIAVDDISLTEGTCNGLFYHEELCVQLDDKTPEETECPKRYLDITNPRLSFDPEKQICSNIYEQTKKRLLMECENRDDSQKCLIDLSIDKSSHPECFQLYEFRIMHTCEDEKPTTVSSVITTRRDSSADEKSTTVSSDITSSGDSSAVSAVETTTVSSFVPSEDSSAISDESVTSTRVLGNSSDSETGLVVGLIIGTLLLVCVVLVIVILMRRHTFKSNPREKIRNNLGGNDYIGSQDIALPLTANHSSHMQNDGMYEQSRNTFVHDYDSIHPNAQINNIQHGYTNLGAVNGFVNKEKVQIPTYADRQNKTLTDNHMLNDDEYAIVDPTAETSFKESIHNRTGNADSYMVLDPTETGFNRQIFSKTPTGYEFAKPVKDTENKICDEDQYDISDEGVYDHSGSNRHKESENNIYNHAVDTIYDSGSHKRNDKGREDTYDHFFGQKTEDDYDVSTRHKVM